MCVPRAGELGWYAHATIDREGRRHVDAVEGSGRGVGGERNGQPQRGAGVDSLACLCCLLSCSFSSLFPSVVSSPATQGGTVIPTPRAPRALLPPLLMRCAPGRANGLLSTSDGMVVLVFLVLVWWGITFRLCFVSLFLRFFCTRVLHVYRSVLPRGSVGATSPLLNALSVSEGTWGNDKGQCDVLCIKR